MRRSPRISTRQLRTRPRAGSEAAAELYEHAARLTPPEQLDEIYRRRHEAASHHFAAGDIERARTIAEEMLSGSIAALANRHARTARGDRRGSAEATDLCREAVEEAGKDKERLAMAYLALARACSILGDFSGQVEAQRNALTHAKRGSNKRLLVERCKASGI